MPSAPLNPDRPKAAQETYREPFTFSIQTNEIQQALREHLASPKDPLSPVVWINGDSELLVYPAQTKLALQLGLVLVDIPLETDQTGQESLVIPFSLGSSVADAALLAATETLPRGHPSLAARWGYHIQEVACRISNFIPCATMWLRSYLRIIPIPNLLRSF